MNPGSFAQGAWITLVVLAALFVVYTYALYPLAIHALGRWRQRAARPDSGPAPDTPAVAIIIVARDEAARIGDKIASCLALDHPADRLSVLVAIDGPDEATAAAVRAIADPRVRLLAFDQHRGKAACLNDAVAACTTPVLLMTDARQRLDRAALRHLLAALLQPGVGVVSGELTFEVAGDDGVGQGIDAYWRYEKFIRRAESAAGSVVGVTGALYAIRREAYRPIPAGTILDDVLIPMRAVMAGWRVGFESRAIAWDRPSQSIAQEQRRKIRTLAGNLQLVELEPGLLDPRRNPILIAFLSHKLFRLLVPFALLALLIGSAVLAPTHGGFALLLVAQLAGYALAIAAGRSPALRRWLPARLASTFLTMNLSALLGVLAWLRGDGLSLWGSGEPAARATPVRRVVYLVSLFPCWSETFIVREIEALLELGVDVRIVSLKPASESLVQEDARRLIDRVTYPPAGLVSLLAAGRELLRAPRLGIGELAGLVAGLIGRPVELLKSLGTWWRTLAMTDAVRALAPDHLHAHWATYPSTAARILARRLDRPWSFTGHAHDIFAHDQYLTAKLVEASFAVTISAFNRQLLGQRLSERGRERLHVVHCGVRLPELPFRPDGRASGRIVAVGRLDPIKGFAHLIEACALLRDQGLDYQCTIIGEGPLKADLQKAIIAAGLGDRVQLAGALPQEAVRAHLAAATVFVLPSVRLADGNADGIPVAMMEAMASGLPVVSTRVSGIPELVRDEIDGLLAPADDIGRLGAALAERIARVLADPAAAQGFARSARQQVERGFDVKVETARLLALFNAAAAANAPAAPTAPAAADPRLRLLIVSDEMEVGGSQRQIVQLARGLDPADVAVTVVYFRNPSFLVDELREHGIEVIEIAKRGRIDLPFLRALRRQLAVGRYDVVHCYSFTAELWVSLARRLLPAARRPALVTSIRGVYEWYNGAQWRIKRWVTSQSEAVISNSRGGARFAARQMAWPEDRLKVIPNGVAVKTVDRARAAHWRERLAPGQDAVLLLFVGRLVEHKNLPRLLAAFDQARRSVPVALKLAIAGDGPLHATLLTDIETRGLTDRVVLLGECDDVTSLMSAADIVVLPSLREGLSNVILEAMIVGRPVIASTAGGNPEAVIDGQTGLTFPPEDVTALAAAIARLADDAALRQCLGSQGRDQALQRFTPAAMTRATREEYRLACHR